MRVSSRHVRPIIAALFFLAIGSTAQLDANAQVPVPANQNFTPQIGQEGKDVIWVPTPNDLVERMMQMANVKSTDFAVDLGFGRRANRNRRGQTGSAGARHRIERRHG